MNGFIPVNGSLKCEYFSMRGSCPRRRANSAIQSICKDMVLLMDWKKESKLDSRSRIHEIRELMEINDCTGAFYCENSRKGACVWIAHTDGPSIKLRVVAMKQMRFFPGNVFKECGALLLFAKGFSSGPHLRFKELVQKLYSTDKPKDRMLCFYIHGGLVWMRCYHLKTMEEVGPRLTLRIEKTLEGCFCGKSTIDHGGGEPQE
ncbi:UNVERIFIED_CONTAM: hypothetical protein PYX00_011835 [Menopon gallinae]|uniref:Ribosome biogenesis protein BRX1 homolog n=1 Tax=Menopon gallinae TaxID=328185 RepID=A0AAW2H8U0_9NEOP